MLPIAALCWVDMVSSWNTSLSAGHPLSTSWLWLSRARRCVLLFVAYLLGGVPLKKVHACWWTRAVFEVYHVSALLDKRDLLDNLVIHLFLPWINRPISTMPHLVTLVLPVTSIAHLLKVVLVILETSLGYMSLASGGLLRLVSLPAHSQHAVLTFPIIVIILDVDLVINVVHVLLLQHLISLSLLALMPLLLLAIVDSLILTCNIRESSFIRIWNLPWLSGRHLPVSIMESGHTRRPRVHLVISFGPLVPQTNDLSGVAQAMGAQGCLGWLTHLVLSIYEFLRIISPVRYPCAVCRVSHLRFRFVSVCGCNFL